MPRPPSAPIKKRPCKQYVSADDMNNELVTPLVTLRDNLLRCGNIVRNEVDEEDIMGRSVTTEFILEAVDAVDDALDSYAAMMSREEEETVRRIKTEKTFSLHMVRTHTEHLKQARKSVSALCTTLQEVASDIKPLLQLGEAMRQDTSRSVELLNFMNSRYL